MGSLLGTNCLLESTLCNSRDGIQSVGGTGTRTKSALLRGIDSEIRILVRKADMLMTSLFIQDCVADFDLDIVSGFASQVTKLKVFGVGWLAMI